ncbi:MAG: hypothetical protein V1661_00980 [bacterium]
MTRQTPLQYLSILTKNPDLVKIFLDEIATPRPPTGGTDSQ